MSQERLLRIYKFPREEGTYKVLTPDCLLMERRSSKVPDDARFTKHIHGEFTEYVVIRNSDVCGMNALVCYTPLYPRVEFSIE